MLTTFAAKPCCLQIQHHFSRPPATLIISAKVIPPLFLCSRRVKHAVATIASSDEIKPSMTACRTLLLMRLRIALRTFGPCSHATVDHSSRWATDRQSLHNQSLPAASTSVLTFQPPYRILVWFANRTLRAASHLLVDENPRRDANQFSHTQELRRG